MPEYCYRLSNGHTVPAQIYEQVMSHVAHLSEKNLPGELFLLLLKLKAEAENHHTSIEEMLNVLQQERLLDETGQFITAEYLEVILDAISVACACTPVVQSPPQVQSHCDDNSREL